jgi:DEAD/DEAH box helicase domain-containing protein
MTPGSNLQLDALETEARLRRRLIEFTESQAYLRNPELRSACRQLWLSGESEGGLVSRIWVEPVLPSRVSGRSLTRPIGRGRGGSMADRSVARLKRVPGREAVVHTSGKGNQGSRERPPAERPGIAITAGTGSGKTEAFLLPLLNDLIRDPRHPWNAASGRSSSIP